LGCFQKRVAEDEAICYVKRKVFHYTTITIPSFMNIPPANRILKPMEAGHLSSRTLRLISWIMKMYPGAQFMLATEQKMRTSAAHSTEMVSVMYHAWS